jgi:hypothetical protein
MRKPPSPTPLFSVVRDEKTRLVMTRDDQGKLYNVESIDPKEPVLWIDVRHGKTANEGEGIYLRMIKCPFAAENPLRFYVDLCDVDMDAELFTNETLDMPERFCQIIRRQLQDAQYSKRPGTLLKFIGNPKKYVDGTISSVDGLLTKDVALDGRGQVFRAPLTESRPQVQTKVGPRLMDRGEYEENYEDDFMIGLALWLPVTQSSDQVRGMRLMRNDLGQLRLYDADALLRRNEKRQLNEEEKHTYRMVFSYARWNLIGNYAHFLRTDAIGTRIPHRLTLPLERTELQVPPLSKDEIEVPSAPFAIPVSEVPLSGLDALRLSPSPSPDDNREKGLNPTGLEPQFRDKKPFSWADYEEEEEDDDDDGLLVGEPRYSLDALTGAIAAREERRVRERSPAGSPASGEEREQKYRKSF